MKLSIINFPMALPPGPSLNPLRGSQCPADPVRDQWHEIG